MKVISREAVSDPRGPLHALVEHEVAGLDVLARDVLVTRGTPERRANWVGVDRDGRLVLVLFVEAGDETAPSLVLAALAFGMESRAAAAKRWRAASVRIDLEPLVVVVAPSYSTRTLRALSFLATQALIVLELRSLELSDGAEPFLVRVQALAGTAAGPAANVLASFPGAVRAVLAELAHDVQRIDPEIEQREHSGTLRWLWRGDEVAHAAAVEGVLVVSEIGSRGQIALDDVASREAWLERFLAGHLARRAGGPRGLVRPLDLLKRSAAPLLSAEELAAFRD
jgi:hypothetical protein